VVISKHFDQLQLFVDTLQERGYGEATTSKMLTILRDNKEELRLELAAILDIVRLVRASTLDY